MGWYTHDASHKQTGSRKAVMQECGGGRLYDGMMFVVTVTLATLCLMRVCGDHKKCGFRTHDCLGKIYTCSSQYTVIQPLLKTLLDRSFFPGIPPTLSINVDKQYARAAEGTGDRVRHQGLQGRQGVGHLHRREPKHATSSTSTEERRAGGCHWEQVRYAAVAAPTVKRALRKRQEPAQ